MAHFAQLDENNIVTQVIVVDDIKLLVDGVELEQAGIDFLSSLGIGSKWVQTSFNGRIRNKFAGIGDTYDVTNDIFVGPEAEGSQYETPWQGIVTPTSPSIMVDAVPRSANRWLNASVNAAFPLAFQRWGYLHQHNPETFNKAVGKFDAIVSVIRNPQDSLASTLNIFGYENSERVIENIVGTTNMLKAIKQNKDNILLFTFEEVTQDIKSVLATIASKVGTNAIEINESEVKDKLSKEQAGSFYSVPIDNADTLANIKAILEKPEYALYIKEANDLYQELIA
jgi:hypothetical protein